MTRFHYIIITLGLCIMCWVDGYSYAPDTPGPKVYVPVCGAIGDASHHTMKPNAKHEMKLSEAHL